MRNDVVKQSGRVHQHVSQQWEIALRKANIQHQSTAFGDLSDSRCRYLPVSLIIVFSKESQVVGLGSIFETIAVVGNEVLRSAQSILEDTLGT